MDLAIYLRGLGYLDSAVSVQASANTQIPMFGLYDKAHKNRYIRTHWRWQMKNYVAPDFDLIIESYREMEAV